MQKSGIFEDFVRFSMILGTGIFDSEATELADAQCAFAEYATIMQGKVERAAWEPRAGGPNFGPRNLGHKYAR